MHPLARGLNIDGMVVNKVVPNVERTLIHVVVNIIINV